MFTRRSSLSVMVGRSLAAAMVLAVTMAFAEDSKPAGDRIYLDEFRPVSQLQVERTAPVRAKFPCINMHTHPAALEDDAIRQVAEDMDAANVALSICLDGQAGLATSDLIQRLQ